MPFSVERVVPWGRSLAEYQAMFGLNATDLDGLILGCGDGPRASMPKCLRKDTPSFLSIRSIRRLRPPLNDESERRSTR